METRAGRHRDDAHGSPVECQFAPGPATLPLDPAEDARWINKSTTNLLFCLCELI